MLTWVVLPMLLSPLVGFVGAWSVMFVTQRLFRDAAHEPAIRGFRMAQAVTAASMSVGHGLQDGQKTMGVLVIALGSAGYLDDALDAAGGFGSDGTVPGLVRIGVAVALGLGTLAGGWRIIRTMSRRLVRMNPVNGFVAEGVASAVLYVSAGVVGVPVSTTHTVIASIVGTGSTRGLRAVRWGVVRTVLVAALLTPVATFAAAAILVLVGRALG